MANYDGDVQLTVNLTPGDVVATAEKVNKDIERVFNKSHGKKVSSQFKSILTTLNQLHNKVLDIREQMSELEGTRIRTDTYINLVNDIKKTEEALEKARAKAQEYAEQVEYFKNSQVSTDAYAALENKLNDLKDELQNLERLRDSFFSKGSDNWSSDALDEMADNFARVQLQIQATETEMKKLEESGQAFVSGESVGSHTAMQEKLDNENATIKELESSYKGLKDERDELEASGAHEIIGEETEEYGALSDKLSEVNNKIVTFLSRLYALGEVDFSSLVVKGFKLIISVGGKVAGILLKIAEHAKDAAISLAKMAGTSIKNKLKDLAKSMLGLNRNAKGTNDVLKGGFRMFLRYGLGIRSVYFLFRRLRKALTEGIENLAQYSGAFNTSMSAMQSALTRLKNSFATAFAPLIEQVAPILVYVANLISEVVTRIGMLIATLTGKNSFTRAKAVTEDYAKSLKSASSATDKNKESTDKLKESWEEYKKTLAGFDDVEILKDMNKDDNDGTGSGSGSGSGSGNNGGYTGPTPEEMFEEVPIAQGLKDLAERIKEAWRTADFTDLGEMVGEKLKDALENIPWDTIKATLNKIAKSIATFLNGFLETPGLFTVIGETIAEALNTAFGAVYTFATNFHWDSLGKAIADGINGFFKKFDFKLAADTFSELAKGILDTIINALENVNWQTVGNKVQEFLTNVDWPGILEKVGEAAGAAVGALAGFVARLFAGVPEAIKKWWEENALDDEGEFVIEGFFNGIVNALADIGTWLYEHLVKPFIKGFEEAFGIGSPSKVMADEGPNIIDGLKQGLEDNVEKLFKWFKELPARIIEKIGDIVLTVTAKIGEVINDIKSKILDFKANITDKVNSIKDKVLDFKANVTDKINSIKDKILDFKANVIDKVNNIKVKVLDFIGNIKDKKDSIKDKLLNFTANLKQKKDSIKEKILSGFTSKITKRDDSLNKNEKVLGGFTSKVTNLIDAIAKKAKLIKGVKAKVEYLEVKRGIKVKGGTVTKAMGGVFANGSWRSLPQFAMGGVIKNGIQRFASGGLPGYGSLFVAGEKGPEIVGNINGRTEILNKSQIASAIYSAVLRGMNTAVNSFGTFISAKLAESTNANLAAIQAGVLAIQNIADQNLIPAITSGRVIPYSMLANTEKQTTALEEIRELLKNNQNSLTYNELYSIIEDVVRKYMNIQFYIGDEQVARHANAGNAKIERRLNPVVR